MANTAKKTPLTVVDNNFVAQGERKDIPWSKLFLSTYNVRKTTPTQLEELSALILAQGGVIENLIVYPEVKNGKVTGNYGVAGGGRRWRSVGLLIKAKKFSKDHPMPSLIVPEDKAIELSIVENSGDEPMHPADEFEAFRALIDGGKEVKDVAALFGVTENTVYRRLRLANVSPRLIAEFREGTIKNISLLEALALTTDHAMQERVWDGLESYERNPRDIRAAIMTDKINIATNPLGRFIGTEAFEAAGGHIERDLFSDKGDGYVSDLGLLASLADEKLSAAAAVYKESGWAWVEIVHNMDYQTLSQYGRARMIEGEAAAEEQARIEEMGGRLQGLADKMEQMEAENEDAYEGEDFQALSDQHDALSDEIDTAKRALMVVAPEHKELAGVLVGIGESGQLKVELARIKPEDRRAAAKNEAGDDGEQAKPKQGHSERLIRQLTAQRTVALQEAVAGNPHVAMVALAVQLFVKTFNVGYNPTGLGVSIATPSLEMNGGDVIKTDRAYVLMNERYVAWEKRLVGDGCADAVEIYSRVAALPLADLYALIALCTARSIDTISGTDSRPVLTNLLMIETGLNMADWWQPTAANYFNSVSKTRTLEVLSAVIPADTLAAVGKLKKGELVAEAEKAMVGQHGLPSELLAM